MVHRQRGAPLSLILTAAVCLFAAGCGSLANTPEQDLARQRWAACSPQATGAQLNAVQVDGRISFWYNTGGDRQAALDCLHKAAKNGPMLPAPLAEPLPGGGAGSGGGGGGM
jgi:hypothetical protein